MTKMPPKDPKAIVTPAGLTKFLADLTKFVATNPDVAAPAYTAAAQRVRALAARAPNVPTAIHLANLAGKLEDNATRTAVTQRDNLVDAIAGEIASQKAEAQAEDAIDVMGAAGAIDPTTGGHAINDHFEELARDFAMSEFHSRADPESDLSTWARFQNIQQRRASDAVPPVRITPSSAKQGQTIFGQTVLVQNNTNAVVPATTSTGFGGNSLSTAPLQEAQILRWEGEDWESMSVTVTLGRVENSGAPKFPTGTVGPNGISYRSYFKLRYGVRGYNQDTITGDIGRGVKFTVNAAFVFVTVGMEAQLGKNSGAMQIGGALSFFAAPSAAPVVRTTYIDTLTPATSPQNVVIPVFATQLLPPQASDVTGTTQLDFRAADNTIIYSVKYTNGTVVAPIPVSNDAYSVDVTNVAGTGNSNYRLVWQLGL